MNQFLKRVIIWIFPILLIVAIAEYLLRKIPNDYQLKVNFYLSHASDIQTLILGNSHAYYDLNPAFFKKYTFNGAGVAQSLDLDADIFFKYENGFTELRYLIISISDMSFFFKLEDLNKWRVKNYAIYYNIHTSCDPAENAEILSLPFSINRHRLISYYLHHEAAVTSSDLGYGVDHKSGQTTDLNAAATRTIQKHKVTDFRNFEQQKAALGKMISFCHDKKIKVILFIPPGYSAYSSHVDSVQLGITLNTCRDFTRMYNNVYFFNLLKDTLFTESDYFDADHLNEIGAKKLSLKMDSILNQLAVRDD